MGISDTIFTSDTQVQEAEVTVHSIAITEAADSKLDLLAASTGGLSFLYSGSSTSNAINEAFLKIGELNSGNYREKVIIIIIIVCLYLKCLKDNMYE